MKKQTNSTKLLVWAKRKRTACVSDFLRELKFPTNNKIVNESMLRITLAWAQRQGLVKVNMVKQTIQLSITRKGLQVLSA